MFQIRVEDFLQLTGNYDNTKHWQSALNLP